MIQMSHNRERILKNRQKKSPESDVDSSSQLLAVTSEQFQSNFSATKEQLRSSS